jgi:hypothetical protein
LLSFLASTETSSWTGNLLVAAIGAVLGGALTISGDIAIRWRSGKSLYDEARERLIAELELILVESRRRVEQHTPGLIQLEPPLPLDAWRNFISAGGLGRIGKNNAAVLADFYRSVEGANYLTARIPGLVSVSVQDPGAVGRSFLDQANRYSVEPAEELRSQATEVLIAAGKAI